MATFQFVTLGVGNAFSALHYSSSLALEADDTWLLIDCAHPIRKVLREASDASGLSLDIDNFAGVVLTHLHGDHASGLEMFGFFSHYALGKIAALYTHPEVAAHLWHGHLAGSMEWSVPEKDAPAVQRHLHDYFTLHYLSEVQPVRCGPFTIECRRTVHSLPTTALRIHACGRTLGYSADTVFDRDLLAWLDEADLIVHETGESGPHTPYADLAKLPKKIRAKMKLIHYPDEFVADSSVIDVLQQGCVYQV